MPSNLAPEIIVTVQNPDPADQYENIASSSAGSGTGSVESEDGIVNGIVESSSSNNIRNSRRKVESDQNGNNISNNGKLCSFSSSSGITTTSAVTLTEMESQVPFSTQKCSNKTKHSNNKNHPHHHHHCSKSGRKTNIIKGDPNSSITTAIDMVEGKPRLWVSPRKSASAVRVQVTLHKPLNWQIVQAETISTTTTKSSSGIAGSFPTKIVKELSRSSTKSTVTHSHSLSQSESLSFSISPSSSIHYDSRHYGNHRHHHRNQQQSQQSSNKGKVRFTNLPRSRLGKHIERIQEESYGKTKEEEDVIRSSVSKSLCFCRCAPIPPFPDDEIINEESSAIDDAISGSVFLREITSSSVLPNGNRFMLRNNMKNCNIYENEGCDGDDNELSKQCQSGVTLRKKKSRSCSNSATTNGARRRASSYHAANYHHRADLASSSNSSSDNEGKLQGSSFQRNYYQEQGKEQSNCSQVNLRGGTRRRRKTKSDLSASVSIPTANQSARVTQTVAEQGYRHLTQDNIFDQTTVRLKKPLSVQKRRKSTKRSSSNSSSSSSSSSPCFAKEVLQKGGRTKLSGGVEPALESKRKDNIPESEDSRRCQYHASFVFKRRTAEVGNKKSGILEETGNRKSFTDSVKKSFNKSGSLCENRLLDQQTHPHRCHYQKQPRKVKSENCKRASHESAQYFQQCQVDPVMTWFKGPSGAEDPHANNKESGMGANGSSHDGRLKSRSQSSSALYCIGKSGHNGSIIEAPGNYGNHNPYSNCHPSAASNGLSSSIPADIWDLPCTAKSYSPLSSAKQHENRQNISHFYPESYPSHLDSYLNSGANTDVEGTTVPSGTGSIQVVHPTGSKLGFGPNSSTSANNNVPLGQVSSRSGKKEKGNKKAKGNARAKLYAVSCPDVAESCGSLPVHPGSHPHHLQLQQQSAQRQFDFTGDPRFIGINEAVTEEHLDPSIPPAATAAMTGSSFTRPYPPLVRANTSNPPGGGNLNTNNHMAQSHPHLYAAAGASSANSSGHIPHSANNPIGMDGTIYSSTSGGVPSGAGGGVINRGDPLFYSQQELQHYQNYQQHPQQHPQQQTNPAHLHQQHFHHQSQQQQQSFHHGPGVSGRGGSSRSGSHHSRSYQNLPCTTQQQYGSGSSSINQPFSTSSSSQQQLYNHHQQQNKQFAHSSSTRSRKSSCGDLKFSQQQLQHQSSSSSSTQQFQMPQFIAPEYIFEVRLIRDHRGLGLSVTGGLDSQETYPGLIRVKKVFPMGPAYESGELRPFDIILEANGAPLSGLTNHEALEVLRTTPTETILTICRPPINIPGFHDSSLSRSVDFTSAHLQSQSQPALNQLTGLGSQYQSQQLVSSTHQQQQGKPFKQTCVQCGGVQRHPLPSASDKLNPSSGSTSSLTPSVKSKSLSSLKIPPISTQSQETFGEFEVTLEKINGSLGFTLRQEDSSVLGHYVRALVKDPALSDGRVHPGDRIISVNGQDLSEMSHTDAINYLRSCPPQVTLRLYRDVSPTPISPLSPTESHKSLKAKPLRKEAIDMLNDLAVRKMSMSSSGGTPDPKHSLPGSVAGRTGLRGHRTLNQDVNGPATLPRRRLQLAGVTPSPEVLSAALSHFAGTAQTKSSKKGLSATEVPTTTTPPASNNSSSSGGSSGYRSSASRLTNTTAANTNSSSSNYPTETRSSGSGESTPVGTIITSKHGKKTDLYRNYSDLRSAIEDDDDADDGIFKGDEEDADLDDDEDEDTERIPTDTLDKEDTESEQTTPKARKPSFRQFTLHLDKISSLEDDDSFTSDLQHHDSIVSEPGYPATDTEMGDGSNFKHGQPAYQSAIISSTTAALGPNRARGKGGKLVKEQPGYRMVGGESSPDAVSDADIPTTMTSSLTVKLTQQVKPGKSGGTNEGSTSKSSNSESGKSGGLLKWKGVVFSKGTDVDEEDYDDDGVESSGDFMDSRESSFRHTAGTSGGGAGGSRDSGQSLNEGQSGEREQGGSKGSSNASDRFLNAKHPLPQRRSPDGREFRECDTEVVNINQQCNGEQIFTVQLSRRWCSRLGFSLQGVDEGTFISAIYPDSVAAKDGRLRVGDELIMINGETVRGRSTAEIIDMMRKIRGMISITIHRRPDSEPVFDPKDHELGLT